MLRYSIWVGSRATLSVYHMVDLCLYPHSSVTVPVVVPQTDCFLKRHNEVLPISTLANDVFLKCEGMFIGWDVPDFIFVPPINVHKYHMLG